MGVDFSVLVYDPCFEMFARGVTFVPVVSGVGGDAYWGRGIYNTRGTVINTEAGMAVLSDQETILDIREREFGTMPVQGDIIDIPADGAFVEGTGTYEVTDRSDNGGGETTLVIRKYEGPIMPLHRQQIDAFRARARPVSLWGRMGMGSLGF